MNHKCFRRVVVATMLSVGCLFVLAMPSFAQTVVVKAVAAEEGTPKEPGVLITAVRADSPAAAAGLKRGDIVLKVNGDEVNSDAELRNALTGKKAGEEVTLTVQHGDEVKELKVTLAPRDDSGVLGVHAESSTPALQFEQVMPFTPAMPLGRGMRWHLSDPISATTFAFSQTIQLQITEVSTDSPADNAGLKEGELIVAVDGESIDHPKALVEAVAQHEPGDEITLTIKAANAGEEPADGSDKREVVVELGKRQDDASQAYLGVRVAPALMLFDAEAGPILENGAPGMPAFEYFSAPEGWSGEQMSADVMHMPAPGHMLWMHGAPGMPLAAPFSAPICVWPAHAQFTTQPGVQLFRAQPGMMPGIMTEGHFDVLINEADAITKLEAEKAAQPAQPSFEIEAAPMTESDEI